MQPYAPPPPPTRNRWVLPVSIGCGGLVLVLIVLGIIGAVLGPPEPVAAPAARPTASAQVASKPPVSPPGRPAVTAQQIVDEISKKWPLPEPTDNTGSCAAKPGDTGKGCVKLITTGSVSVYEFADEATARHWVTEMKRNGDWRQAGRFALAWTARDQDFTSDEARADMVKTVERLVS